MRNLTATLCLTIAVLLGSAGVSWGGDFQSYFGVYPYWGYITLLLILIGVIGIWYRNIRRVQKKVVQCLTVWAAQGPFDSGVQSFEAYKRAIKFVYRDGNNQILLDSIANHQLMFDLYPQNWETRRICSLVFGDGQAIEVAKKLLKRLASEADNLSKSNDIMDYNEKYKFLNKLLENRNKNDKTFKKHKKEWYSEILRVDKEDIDEKRLEKLILAQVFASDVLKKIT